MTALWGEADLLQMCSEGQCPLSWTPHQLPSSGLEHGRTIPLEDIGRKPKRRYSDRPDFRCAQQGTEPAAIAHSLRAMRPARDAPRLQNQRCER